MPTLRVNLAEQLAGQAPYTSGSSSSKMKLQSDKGGETAGRGIEDLLEDLIPRFTEIIDPPQSHSQDSEVLPNASTSNGDKSYLDASDHVLLDKTIASFSHMDISHLNEKTSSPPMPMRSAMKQKKKATVPEDYAAHDDRNSDMQDWLVSIDKDIAATGDGSVSSISSVYTPARESLPSSPLRPPSITIKGRALEASSLSLRSDSLPSTISSPRSTTHNVPTRNAPDHNVPASNANGKGTTNGQRDIPPHLAGLAASRSSSPPLSAVSAASKSHVSSAPSSRITLGAAAAGWKFDQRSKPFEREYTIDPKRARNQPPSMFRQGHPLQPQHLLNGIRRPPHSVPGHAAGPRGSMLPARGPPRPPMGGMQGLGPMQRFPGPGPVPPFAGSERHLNVEIRISNVPPACSKDELYAILGETALHRAPFSNRDRKLNFWVHLPRAKHEAGNWGHSNEGFAFLTLPTADLVHRFLSKFGRNGTHPAMIRAPGSKNTLAFERGTRVPPAGILEWLNRVPYPEKGDRSQRVINDRKADNLALMRLEFGVFCRDGVYSPEYVTTMKNCRFSFDYRHRTFRVSKISDTKPGQTPSTHLLVIKSSSIRLTIASVEDDEYSATLILTHPPAYEELLSRPLYPEDEAEEDQISSNGSKVPVRAYTGRQRRPGWDIHHQKTAAFTSRAIRFVFETENLRNDFEDLLLSIGCSHAKHAEMTSQSRQLYKTSRRKEVHKWLAEVPSRSVAFQLACLYQNNLLVPKDVMALKKPIEDLFTRKGAFVTSDILHQYVEELTRLQQRWIEGILKDTRHASERDLAQPSDPLEALNNLINRGISRVNWREGHQSTIMQCLHVVLTPTSMILEGPYPDQSNRPLRKYGHHDHFIRVAFMDEDKQPYYWGPDIDWTAFLDERVGAILRGGITLGGKQYEFLGYSMSSLRNRSTWFCTEFEMDGQLINADYIRQNLGDFEKVKRQPARYGARMAQAFTATDPSIVLKEEEIELIPDVEKVYRNELLCFTDGVGKISLSMTRRVWSALHGGMEPVGILPSAFQFRLGGYKGVLTVDSALEGDKICVRPSQQKFDAPESLGLEVAYTYTTYMSMFLNRPLIKVLEDLEVPPESFMSLLKEAVRHAEELKEHVRETRRQLSLHGLGGPFGVTDLVENIASLLRTNRISPFKESGRLATFVANSLEYAEVHILRLLKLKARIPVSKAHVGVAVADESGTLKEGEVYAMRHVPGEEPYVVNGDVLLVRAPTVDVGDVQFARAIGTPPPGAERFQHIPNVVIFSVQGPKPLLTQLSRGDMDGDLVGVIYDKRLFPKRTEPAMQHNPKTPAELSYDCTIHEVIDFVLRFFRNDILGMIANRHLLIADQAPGGFDVGCGTRHPACKKLAALQTVAVDAPKSGQSVDLAEMPRPLFPHRPDFMTHEQLLNNSEPDEEALIYHSNKVLGKLYRAISLTSQEMENSVPKEAEPLDPHYVAAGEDDHILLALMDQLEKCGLDTSRQASDEKDRKDAWFAMHSYASDLRHVAWSNTMNSGHPLSEHELFIGTILHGPLATKQKQELTQRINLQSKELIDGVLMRLEGPDGRDRPQQWTNRVLAAMRVALSQMGNFGAATYACIAMRSCLFLLALMRDVQKAQVFASGFQADEEQPFMPVITDDMQAGLMELSGLDGMTEGVLGGPGASNASLLHLDADEGGEAVDWQSR